jgi:hypothetical protein
MPGREVFSLPAGNPKEDGNPEDDGFVRGEIS